MPSSLVFFAQGRDPAEEAMAKTKPAEKKKADAPSVKSQPPKGKKQPATRGTSAAAKLAAIGSTLKAGDSMQTSDCSPACSMLCSPQQQQVGSSLEVEVPQPPPPPPPPPLCAVLHGRPPRVRSLTQPSLPPADDLLLGLPDSLAFAFTQQPSKQQQQQRRQQRQSRARVHCEATGIICNDKALDSTLQLPSRECPGPAAAAAGMSSFETVDLSSLADSPPPPPHVLRGTDGLTQRRRNRSLTVVGDSEAAGGGSLRSGRDDASGSTRTADAVMTTSGPNNPPCPSLDVREGPHQRCGLSEQQLQQQQQQQHDMEHMSQSLMDVVLDSDPDIDPGLQAIDPDEGGICFASNPDAEFASGAEQATAAYPSFPSQVPDPSDLFPAPDLDPEAVVTAMAKTALDPAFLSQGLLEAWQREEDEALRSRPPAAPLLLAHAAPECSLSFWEPPVDVYEVRHAL